MIVETSRCALVGMALLTVVGCSSLPVQDPATIPPETEAARLIGNAQTDQEIVLPEINAVGLSSVYVGHAYTAASGRACRPLLSDSGLQLMRVVCQRDDNRWYLQRSLSVAESTVDFRKIETGSTVTLALSDMPIANELEQPELLPLQTMDPSADDLVERPLLVGETLWSFALRLTGNALNWEKIAEVNDIDDTTRLATTLLLLVPTELLQEGR